MTRDMREKGRSAYTIKNYLHCLEYWARSRGEDLKLEKPQLTLKMPNYLTMDEVHAMYRACENTRDHAILSVLLYTGIRNKELRALEIEDVDLSTRRLYIRDRGQGIKNYRESAKIMRAECVESLKHWIDSRPVVDSMALFVTRDGRRFSTKGLEGVINRLKARAGVDKPKSTHLCRDTCFTWMAFSGISEALIQRQSGHKDRRSLEHYIAPSEEGLRANIDERFHY